MFSVTRPYVAPVMLYQLVVLAPIAFVVLDLVESGRRPSWRRVLIQPVRNPVILASVLGIVLAATGHQIPEVVDAPLTLIAGMAVPGALIAFGISLRGAPAARPRWPGRPTRSGHRAQDRADADGGVRASALGVRARPGCRCWPPRCARRCRPRRTSSSMPFGTRRRSRWPGTSSQRRRCVHSGAGDHRQLAELTVRLAGGPARPRRRRTNGRSRRTPAARTGGFGQQQIVHAVRHPDAGDVHAQPGRPAGDGVGVEHGIPAKQFVGPLPGPDRPRRTQHQDRNVQPEPGMGAGDGALRGRQPFDPDDAARDGLPLRDEIPFAALAAVGAQLVVARPAPTAAPSSGGSWPAPRAVGAPARASPRTPGTSRNGLFSTTALTGATSPVRVRRSCSQSRAISPPVE